MKLWELFFKYWHVYICHLRRGLNYKQPREVYKINFWVIEDYIYISQSQNYQSITQKQSVIYLNVEGEV